MHQITNEATLTRRAECQAVTPKVPLKGDDRSSSHTCPHHAKGRLPTRQARIEESKPGYHNEHHGRGHDDEGLIARLEPLVDIFKSCEEYKSQLSDPINPHRPLVLTGVTTRQCVCC